MNLSAITPENLTISTDRLILSLMTLTDLSNFSLLQTDVELMKYIGPILSGEDIKTKFLDRIKPFNQEEGHWLTLNIHDKETNEFIGSIGFKLDSIIEQRFEVGYLVLKNILLYMLNCTYLYCRIYDQLYVKYLFLKIFLDKRGSKNK